MRRSSPKNSSRHSSSRFGKASRSPSVVAREPARHGTQESTRPRPQGSARPGPQGSARPRPRHSRGEDSSAASARRDFINVPPRGRMIMGDHAIREAFRVNSASLDSLVLLDQWKDSENLRELESLARQHKLRLETRTSQTLDRLGTHQGALLIAKDQPGIAVESLLSLEQATILALDGVEDPHNLGAVLRSAWLMGVTAVLIPEDRAVGLTPVVHKVAAGGVEHVPVIRDNNFASIFERLKENGYWIYGLSHKAQGLIYDLKLPAKIVWVLGAEDKGLRTSTEKVCDELVRFPQLEAEASYNVSVAAAMTLSETYRQISLPNLRTQPPGR